MTINIEVTESELRTIIKALETEKITAFRNNDEAACTDAILLGNALRDVQEPSASTAVVTKFDETRYVRSHGKSPRGRGKWLFELTTGEVVFDYEGTLTDAKAAARRHMRDTCQPGVRTLFICP